MGARTRPSPSGSRLGAVHERPVSRLLEVGWVHKRPIGRPVDANGHWDVTLVRTLEKVSCCTGR